jgi:TATA-box binding protein (TBP) (component of TFIID and TFIIIB)
MEDFNLDNEWEQFMNTNFDIDKLIEDNISKKQNEVYIPKCSDIYISTKTKIAYLNQCIDIEKIFWLIPIMEYYNTNDGVIKKQMKITTFSEEETNQVNEKLKLLHNQKSLLISHFKDKKTKNDVKYKHIQKISIGICKKDIITYRSKEKGAFYNCFAIIVRLKIKEIFKEIHIKIFNTGKLEIPGIQDDELLYKSLNFLVDYLKPYTSETLCYNKMSIDTVLINSNFNCGYYIDRETLFNKLKHSYNLITMYDPCSYPGIQSKFYFNENKTIQDGICKCSKQCSKKGSGTGNGECREISFMIFRTGSVLIVGHCNEDTLNIIYDFIKNILEKEYYDINEGNIVKKEKKDVIKKVRKYKIIQDN